MGDPGARLATFGPNTPLNLDRPHMVKTGTTDDYRDTWTIGCVPQVCVGVWMGKTNNDPMVKVSSSLTAGKVWVEMIQALIERKRWPPEPWARPAQFSEAFDFIPLDDDADGWRRFQVRIRIGGSPSLVALEKLTPLFEIDGKGPVQYVTEAFFEANPGRTPRSIQPDDTFVLRLPPDAFVVRWQEEREEDRPGKTRSGKRCSRRRSSRRWRSPAASI
jgi:membrane peptidoglycan carboxypeptidase